MRSSCLSASNLERVERSVNDGSINLLTDRAQEEEVERTDRFVVNEGIEERSVLDAMLWSLLRDDSDSEGLEECSAIGAMLWSLLRDDRRTVAVRLVLDEED